MRKFLAVLLGFLWGYHQLWGVDLPGAFARVAENLRPFTYEMTLIPSVLFHSKPSYLTSQIRYQFHEDFGAGFSFGAGEIGFSTGVMGEIHILPDVGNQLALAVVVGVFFNRTNGISYWSQQIAPIISKRFELSWATLIPYSALKLTPSFAIGPFQDSFGIQWTLGSLTTLKIIGSIRLYTELGIGISQSYSHFSLGIAYPFSAIES